MFRTLLIVGVVIVFPITVYHRLKSQATREPLDRRQEGWFILLTLRPVGLVFLLGLLAYLIDPAWMAWSAVPIPGWLQWMGVATYVLAGSLFIWTLRSLGKNLTDTVVTRRAHTLVTTGPYRWVRHPFYDAMGLFVVAVFLMTANWFFLANGALVLLLIRLRTPTEEEKLLARFGDAYRSYRERTGRFFPKTPAQSNSRSKI